MVMMYLVEAVRNRNREEYEVKISVRASSGDEAVEKAKVTQPGMDTYRVIQISELPQMPELL